MGKKALAESNEPVEKEAPEEAQDEALKKEEKRKKARLRTRDHTERQVPKACPMLIRAVLNECKNRDFLRCASTHSSVRENC